MSTMHEEMPPISKFDADQDPRRWLRAMLALVCKEVREAADGTILDVAHAAGIHPNNIGLFEKGKSFPKMENVDRYIAAYAEVGELKDPFQLLEKVARYWRTNGAPPLTAPEAKSYGPMKEMITPAEMLREITEAPSPASEEPTSTDRRRAGGE